MCCPTAIAAGKPWIVELDENTPPTTGLTDQNASDLRKRVLYDVYFSGAGGVEWYFGYQPNPIGGDVDVEDFRSREPMWKYMRLAREFMEVYLPFASMGPMDHLVTGESSAYGGAEVFAQPRHPYTQALFSATPVADPNRRKERVRLKGEPPSPLSPPPGCPFAPRCFMATEACTRGDPPLEAVNEEVKVACIHVEKPLPTQH